MGIDEDIGVDQNHLKFSPSATASTSVMLSMLGIRKPPNDTGLVRTPRRGFMGLVISPSPLRSASLINSFKLISRDLRSRWRIAATSSSTVRVVLISEV